MTGIVESNDVLYAGDADYLDDIQELMNKLVDTVLDEISKFSQAVVPNAVMQIFLQF
jgi:hypothetical protein